MAMKNILLIISIGLFSSCTFLFLANDPDAGDSFPLDDWHYGICYWVQDYDSEGRKLYDCRDDQWWHMFFSSWDEDTCDGYVYDGNHHNDGEFVEDTTCEEFCAQEWVLETLGDCCLYGIEDGECFACSDGMVWEWQEDGDGECIVPD